MAGIYKAYDIRGIYGDDFTEAVIHDIGRAFVTFLGCKKVVIGRDMRPHSQPLFEALATGITRQGADVVDLGVVSTPMTYHGIAKLGADAGIMLTASHNPGEWNGTKLTREQAIPISGATGIQDIERIVNEGSFAPEAQTAGSVSTYNVIPEYVAYVQSKAELARPVHLAIDMANGMGIVEAEALDGTVTFDGLFDELDGSFPNHEANPLKESTLVDLQTMTREGSYDFGVAYDGDADRAGFIDEKGQIVPMDIITALIAKDVLRHEKGTFLYDLRSSRAVGEIIEENGGRAIMCRVGHAFIKQQMREEDAVFAGELSGHYYFRDNFFTESSSKAILCVANIVSQSDKPLSELVAPIKRYFASGEINSEVEDTAVVLERIRQSHPDGRHFELDGVSVELDDFWFNVRGSNTEPLIRLNLEAVSQEVMEAKRDEVLALIRG
ncbi:MAG: phosphomannomutase/phosphoglucomutase [Kiritimatiellae bacterium]|nr:phosphomannomutase/phosphoglucomutase [Kiritimatiellia bacterium]